MSKINSAADVVNFIKDIEDHFNPQKWKINDVDIWPVLRVNLYYELTVRMMNMEDRKPSLKQKLKRLYKAFLSLLVNTGKPAEILLVSDGISYVKMESHLYERFCDPIISILEKRSTSWQKWNLTGDLKGNLIYEAINVAGILDFLFITSRLNRDQLTDQVPDLAKFLAFVSERTERRISWSVNKINGLLNRFLTIEKWYLRQLKLINPVMVVIVSYYSDRGMALIKACKELGIRIADIQHGIQGEMHVAYSNWQEAPHQGYNTLPDDFIVWSETERTAISKWANGTTHSPVVLGNLFEERWFGKHDDTIILTDIKVQKITAGMKAERSILFTLQYGLEYDDWIFDLIKNTQAEFNWLIRLHPVINDDFNAGKLKDRMEKHGITNYELALSSSLPLYGILRNVNLHATCSSTTVIEAKNFGIRSIILSDYGAELFAKEINDNQAYYTTDQNRYTLGVLNSLSEISYFERISSIDVLLQTSCGDKTENYLQTYL